AAPPFVAHAPRLSWCATWALIGSTRRKRLCCKCARRTPNSSHKQPSGKHENPHGYRVSWFVLVPVALVFALRNQRSEVRILGRIGLRASRTVTKGQFGQILANLPT